MICPLCGSSCSPMQSHPAAELFRCRKCSHAFTFPESVTAPESYGASYYERDHKRWFEHPDIELFDRVLAQAGQGASVVDVGCGRGCFLRYAHAMRPDLRLTGIDLSPNANEPGIRFFQHDVLKMRIEEQFDVVVSLAVIEHVAEVGMFVQQLRRLVKPGGMVVVMTINDHSVLYAAARLGRYFALSLAFNRLYSVHHLHHFTRRSLTGLLTRSGWIVRKHWDHNPPIEAMDLPVRNRQMDSSLRFGLFFIWLTGKALRRSWLQTVVCEIPSTQKELEREESPLLEYSITDRGELGHVRRSTF